MSTTSDVGCNCLFNNISLKLLMLYINQGELHFADLSKAIRAAVIYFNIKIC